MKHENIRDIMGSTAVVSAGPAPRSRKPAQPESMGQQVPETTTPDGRQGSTISARVERIRLMLWSELRKF
jgi:hypothetical protein